ncbi:hypothetical protein Leryth_020192 [Lithospermum erythrorhizon]|nr:hypothetical protein Leryth_020192 [Lithospermum erythrorhizon]
MAEVDIPKLTKAVLCYSQSIYRYNGVWDGPDPMVPTIPLALVQLTIVMVLTRICIFVVRLFKQPSFVGRVIAGIMLGPSIFGKLYLINTLFPPYSFRVLEPLAQFALSYYAFLTGLQMDVKSILHTESKGIRLACAGILIPFMIGTGLYYMFKVSNMTGFIFLGGSLAATGYPVLAQILTDQRIIHTEVGRIAMGAALISDLASWVFVGLGLILTNSKTDLALSLLTMITFILVSFYYLRRVLKRLIGMKTEGVYGVHYTTFILMGASICGVITEGCGTHPMLGAFIYGLCIPSESLKASLLDKLEDSVMEIFMPLFYLVTGLRVDIDGIAKDSSWFLVIIALVMALIAKPLSTFLLSSIQGLPLKDAFPLGVFAGTKSVMALILLEIGNSQKALSTQTYSLMVIATLMMTMLVTPISISYRPSEDLSAYKRRTIQKAGEDEELRILACVHDAGNIPTIVNLLTSSNPSLRSPICVFALQLVELIGRAPATLVVHSSGRSTARSAMHTVDQVDQLISAFDNLELRSEGLSAQIMTAKSNYTTMGVDICNVAKENLASFIILPFCKVNNIEGGDSEEVNSAIRAVCEDVLATAPCSVGILIDRLKVAEPHVDHARNIAMLYFGGPDDREAMSFAMRMAENPEINLTVVRFETDKDASEFEYINSFAAPSHVTVQVDLEKEMVIDDHFLNHFKFSTEDAPSITYIQLILNDEEEATKAIKAMDSQKFDLYIVGKGTGMRHPLTAGLADWCDCPELGPIGDLLVTSEFESSFSVLVVQQYVRSSAVFSIADRDGSMMSAGALS